MFLSLLRDVCYVEDDKTFQLPKINKTMHLGNFVYNADKIIIAPKIIRSIVSRTLGNFLILCMHG